MKRSDAGDVSPVAMFYPDGMLFQDFSLSNASLRGSNTIPGNWFFSGFLTF